jgi:hypothetical protein
MTEIISRLPVKYQEEKKRKIIRHSDGEALSTFVNSAIVANDLALT